MDSHTPQKPIPDELRDKDILDFRTNLERQIWIKKKNLLHRLHPQQNENTSILIAGMQRSGSKLLMQLFEWSKYTDCYPEDDDRAYDHYQLRNVDKIRELRSKSKADFFVIKCLCELDQIYVMLEIFSPAKTVWIVRDFRDCVNSCIRNFSAFAQRAHRLAKDRNLVGWRGRGMSDETWEIMRRLDNAKMNEATGAALQWYYRNILFFEQNLELDDRVKVVHYEDLVTNQLDTVADIYAFTGISDASPWITRKIHARSLKKNEAPPISDDVFDICMKLQQRFLGVSRKSKHSILT